MLTIIATSQFINARLGLPVVDSHMSRSQAIGSSTAPQSIRSRQAVVRVSYFGFDHRLHRGQIVVDRALAREVQGIFAEILSSRFPIARVIPVSKFGWSDLKAMEHNDTSGFNYRTVFGGHRLSDHASGRAIDINPIQNPDAHLAGRVGGSHRPGRPGTITRDSAVYRAFVRRGWKWGGLWSGKKDYQHFYKP